MAIAQRERAFDRGAADIALHAIGAEPEPRQPNALDLKSFHAYSLKSAPPCGLLPTASENALLLWAG
jgi:hypothetical protein